jgi:hypothetical protein
MAEEDDASAEAVAARRKRTNRPFPAASFEETLEFANAIFEIGGGQPVRRLTLFDHLKKAPESGPSRQLITNASKYGLMKGNAASEHLQLTEDGLKSVDDGGHPKREVARARVKLAIEEVEPFKRLYEQFVNSRLPAKAVLVDAMTASGVGAEFADEGVDTLIVNLRFVGLLQTLSGADRIVTVDHLLDTLPSTATIPPLANASAPFVGAEGRSVVTQEQASFDTTCFYVTPIGEPDSVERRHSDLFLGNIVEPALATFGLKVVRADAIDKPGMITRQVIEYLVRSRLVIADLSFHNPNVFYEICLRHAVRQPIVQLIRAGERIPFDIHQMRTIVIDNTDIYTLVPKIETYRSEIANQARRALEEGAEVDTPLSIYFPGFKVSF